MEPSKRSSSGRLVILSVAGFVLIALGVIIFLFNQNQNLKQMLLSNQVTPSSQTSINPTPTENPTLTQEGTVSGKLCYPSSFLPPGEIVAKNLSTEQLYTQSYIGSMAGGASTYSIDLPPGVYHLKYQAHASTKDTSIFTSGYYDECAKTTHTNECTPDSGHINIDVTVLSGQENKNIDLCDFYYNPTQEQSLNQNF